MKYTMSDIEKQVRGCKRSFLNLIANREMAAELKQVVYSFQELLLDFDFNEFNDVPIFWGLVDYSSDGAGELFKLHQF